MATKFFQVGKFGSAYDQASEVAARDLSTARVITAISQAAAAVVTSAAHGLLVGDVVDFAGVVGMVEINGLTGKISAVTADTFTVNIASTLFTAYTSDGTATPVTPLSADLGLLYDDTEPSGDLLSTLLRVRDRLVQLEG